MKNSKGSASLGILVYLAVFIGSFITVLALLTPFQNWRDASQITTQIIEIKQAAELSYKDNVMLNRCISISKPMSINRLISEKRVDKDINAGLVKFSVLFHQLQMTHSWKRPSRIEITVTFENEHDLFAVQSHLPPAKHEPKRLIFSYPLLVDTSYSSATFNKQTGCFQ